MRNKIKEANKLPLGFEYLEFRKTDKNNKPKDIKYFVSSDKLKTDFMQTHSPSKNLVRLL